MKLSNGLGSLTLVCSKCTREATIAAPSMEAAVFTAKLQGWVVGFDVRNDQTLYVCPTCLAHRPQVAA